MEGGENGCWLRLSGNNESFHKYLLVLDLKILFLTFFKVTREENVSH